MELTIFQFYQKINKKLLLLTIILGFIFYPLLFQFNIKEKIIISYKIHTYSVYTKNTYRESVNQLFYRSLLENTENMECRFNNETLITINCSVITNNLKKKIDSNLFEEKIKKIYSEVNLNAINFTESLSDKLKKDPIIYIKEFKNNPLVDKSLFLNNNIASAIDEQIKKYNDNISSKMINELKEEAANKNYLSINKFIQNQKFNFLSFFASFLGIVFTFLSVNYLLISQKD